MFLEISIASDEDVNFQVTINGLLLHIVLFGT